MTLNFLAVTLSISRADRLNARRDAVQCAPTTGATTSDRGGTDESSANLSDDDVLGSLNFKPNYKQYKSLVNYTISLYKF